MTKIFESIIFITFLSGNIFSIKYYKCPIISAQKKDKKEGIFFRAMFVHLLHSEKTTLSDIYPHANIQSPQKEEKMSKRTQKKRENFIIVKNANIKRSIRINGTPIY
jgi:hypothetical protein